MAGTVVANDPGKQVWLESRLRLLECRRALAAPAPGRCRTRLRNGRSRRECQVARPAYALGFAVAPFRTATRRL